MGGGTKSDEEVVWTKVLYAEFMARPDTVDRVGEPIRGLAEEVRQTPGNEVFSVHREQADPLHFFVFEVYRAEQAFQDDITATTGPSSTQSS